jgi:hypothetical protein
MKLFHNFSSNFSYYLMRAKSAIPSWLVPTVIVPFIITRLIWLFIAWFSTYYLPNPTYNKYTSQGWFLSPHFLVDIWCRWDAKWYLSIVETGYQAPTDLTQQINNMAFYPFYPYLIKGLSTFIPSSWLSRSVFLVIGLLISNLAFLLAIILLYRFVKTWTADEIRARHTLEYLFVFPTSFYFSCFYSESLFFLLSIGAANAASKKKWLIASLLGSCLALTRPQGILIMIPLAWYYLAAYQWKVKALRFNIAWLGLIPTALALHFLYLHSITGSYWAPVLSQMAWGRGGSLFLDIQQLLASSGADVFKIETLIWVIVFIMSLWGIKRLPSPGLGIFTLAMLIMPVATGSVLSIGRFILVIFPVFILLSDLIRSPFLRKVVLSISFCIQVLYFLGWVNYYWIA